MSVINQILADAEQRREYFPQDDFSAIKDSRFTPEPELDEEPHTSHAGRNLLLLVLLIIIGIEGINRLPIKKAISSISDTPSIVMNNPADFETQIIEKYQTDSTLEMLRPESIVMIEQPAVETQQDPVKTIEQVHEVYVPPATMPDDLVDITAAVTGGSYAEIKSETMVEDESFPPVLFEKRTSALTENTSSHSTYEQAVTYIQNNQHAQGTEVLIKLLETDQQHVAGRLLLVSVHLEKAQVKQAKALLTRGLYLLPKETKFALPMAHILVNEGNLHLALKVLQQAMPNAAIDPDYYSFIAALQQQRGQHQNAIDLYKKILSLQPENGKWWMGMGISLLAIGQNDKALSAFQSSLRDRQMPGGLREFSSKRILDLQKREG